MKLRTLTLGLSTALLAACGGGGNAAQDGKVLNVSEERPGTMAASRLLGRWYDQTPRIANEQLMRATASRTPPPGAAADPSPTVGR